jgi:antitoxin Phd
MLTVTAAEAQRRFGELMAHSAQEPIEVTGPDQTVVYVVSEHDMRELMDVRRRREEAARWYAEYRQKATAWTSATAELTDDDVNALVHELR